MIVCTINMGRVPATDKREISVKINLSLVQCRYTRKHPLKLNIYYISTKQQLHKKEKSHARAPALHMPELPGTFQQHRGHPLFPLFKKIYSR